MTSNQEMDGGIVPLLIELPVGERLTGLRRAYYVYGADLDAPDGPLEASFEKSGSYMIDSTGESLVITQGPWIDSFADPLSPENEKFVRESGKWEIVDMGAAAWSYRQFLGLRLDRQELGGSPAMEQSLTLTFGKDSIVIKTSGDETRVSFHRST
ncbi:hypothetical protein [Actinoplanes palleronii]|uniref:Lipocalin-like domain-containing protein n=1 Tax=Actinoplanes palleronii TaxID=113570 RepID=A0ABQ4BG75_9ACTN|nr:hypothetical protein [Actinoplanes palleronii]GIE69679.1 hypothetical protein Apa02nite_057870 [Actinoplanes palleronii]